MKIFLFLQVRVQDWSDSKMNFSNVLCHNTVTFCHIKILSGRFLVLFEMRRSDWLIMFLKTNLSLALMAGKFNLTARILFKVDYHIKLRVIFMAKFDMNLINIAINLFFQGECKIKSTMPQCH